MTAAIAQMFAGGGPLNEDTVFDIEFTDEHVADGGPCLHRCPQPRYHREYH